MQNNKTQPKRRTKTKNQKRIEKLLEEYPTAVEGLNKGMLQLPNCPKVVRISTKIIDFESDQKSKENMTIKRKVTKRELICFMIKKFNIFLDHSDEEEKENENENENENELKRESEWVTFRPSSQKNFDSIITLIDSKEFEKQLSLTTKRLRYWYEQDSTSFQGVEPAHLSSSYRIPCNVIIDKNQLKKFCAENSETDRSSQIKKVYRAFSFFFLARFNCINSTHKNRKKMFFSRNYKFGFGNSQLNKNKIEETFPKTKNEKKIRKESTKHIQLKRTRKRKRKTPRPKRISTKEKFVDPDFHYSSFSSGDEIERETILPPNQTRTKERKMIITQERKTQNNVHAQNSVDNRYQDLQQLQSKTEQELEGELIWLLVNLKSHYRN
ncbi:hypothetical protein M0812_20756 [Anaeramoeba flamelloides]|uniref:Uncharacterized protein n=1 Tax=Anaeramoeba flamelloides TaxID=1746091 RepID=A0AAV7YPX1_9EUKA|nr:hypothetical protein M0812_20756 [Anaeramoeba flamelloides]